MAGTELTHLLTAGINEALRGFWLGEGEGSMDPRLNMGDEHEPAALSLISN